MDTAMIKKWLLLLLVSALPAWGFEAPSAGVSSEAHSAVGTVEVAFAPWDDGEALLQKAIAGARQHIYVQAYIFTSRNVAHALVSAKERGVKVDVLVDAQNAASSDSSQIPMLAQAGIPVFVETRYAAAHNKVMVIDPDSSAHCAVLTGSYNFTQAARTRNAENLLLLKGDPTLARAYLANWKRHRAEAQPFGHREQAANSRTPRSKTSQEHMLFPWEGRGR